MNKKYFFIVLLGCASSNLFSMENNNHSEELENLINEIKVEFINIDEAVKACLNSQNIGEDFKKLPENDKKLLLNILRDVKQAFSLPSEVEQQMHLHALEMKYKNLNINDNE